MAYLIDEETLQSIANAIRGKTGESAKLSPAGMAGKVTSELQKPAASKAIGGDGVFDVKDCASVTVSVEAVANEQLFYEYAAATGALTISVNQQPTVSYSSITLDQLLADLYIGNMRRGYSAPEIKGADWFRSWCSKYGITTLALYKAKNKAMVWDCYTRAKFAETAYQETLPHNTVTDSMITGRNFEYSTGEDGAYRETRDEWGTADGGLTRKITTYLFVREKREGETASKINIVKGVDGYYTTQTEQLAPGTYTAGFNCAWSGDAWTGTWVPSLTLSFSGGTQTKADVKLQPGGTCSFTIAEEDPVAERVHLKIRPDDSISAQVDFGAELVQTMTFYVRRTDRPERSQTSASLSAALRYADGMDPRYKFKTEGFYYPLLLIDPVKATVKGYPYNADDYAASRQNEEMTDSGATISCSVANGPDIPKGGDTMRVSAMRVEYRPSANATQYLLSAGGDYVSYQYAIVRKGDADG